MAKQNSFFKNYGFLILMLIGIVAGCIVGAVWPGATALEWLGTIFINLMFCVVVPMVFFSISSAIANMSNAKRAGKVISTTVIVFLCTAAIAAVIMYVIVRVFPIFTMAPQYEESEADTFVQSWQQLGASSPNQSLRDPSSAHSMRCCAPVIPHTLVPRNSFISS